MISQNKRKTIRALEQKKRRDTEGLFVAEGRKTVGDLLRGGLTATYIAATEERMAELGHETAGTETVVTEADEIAEVSQLKTRSEIIAIFRKPNAMRRSLRTARLHWRWTGYKTRATWAQ